MVEFKAVVSDPKSGRTYTQAITGHYVTSLIGRKIGEEIDGIFVGLPGYKLMITGGSDKDGVPMIQDLPGPRKKKILTSKRTGFKPVMDGERKRKTFRGNTISQDIVQINMKISVYGPKNLDDYFKKKEAK
jgi:small subunit ribosomal protein S6e